MRAPSILSALALTAMLSGAALPDAAAATPSEQDPRYCPASDSYQVGPCDSAPLLPATPVGRQLGWLLPHLAEDAGNLTAGTIAAHTDPELLRYLPADRILAILQGTIAETGPLRFVGFNYPPRAEQAVALVQGDGGVRAAVGLGVSAPAGLINLMEITLAPPTIVPNGRYSGWFDIGGRRLFLRCTGQGSPTVVFENGLTHDWYDIQNAVSPTTRACSYDPALQNAPFTRSDPAPTPRHARVIVRDLDRLLGAAEVPGPYVLVGHSNGGLFSLLYASEHPDQVAGMVLVDPVHPDYHARDLAMLRDKIDPATWAALAESACVVLPAVLDTQRLDICRSEAQTRRALRHHPIRPMPLSMISHGRPADGQYPPGWPVAAEEALWRQLQNEIAALVPGAHHVVAELSDHDIQHEQPQIVLAEIDRVVRAVRSGSTAAA